MKKGCTTQIIVYDCFYGLKLKLVILDKTIFIKNKKILKFFLKACYFKIK